MPYTSAQKADALRLLRENDNNISQTSRESGISTRTLKRWQSDPAPLSAATPLTLRETMTRLEALMCGHALNLADNLLDDDQKAPLNQRASALGLLFDRLVKLHEWQAAQGDNDTRKIAIVYKDPDGSIHDKPHWMREWEQSSDDTNN